jgi:hypothetical protein
MTGTSVDSGREGIMGTKCVERLLRAGFTIVAVALFTLPATAAPVCPPDGCWTYADGHWCREIFVQMTWPGPIPGPHQAGDDAHRYCGIVIECDKAKPTRVTCGNFVQVDSSNTWIRECTPEPGCSEHGGFEPYYEEATCGDCTPVVQKGGGIQWMHTCVLNGVQHVESCAPPRSFCTKCVAVSDPDHPEQGYWQRCFDPYLLPCCGDSPKPCVPGPPSTK